MRTQYASGRATLPAPAISASTGGSIAGGGNTYYFYIQARNRVGYNLTSPATALVIANSGSITINASSFAAFAWEDWRHFVVLVSTTASYSNARVIYKQELYQTNQYTQIALANVVINANFVINDTGVYASSNLLPAANVPNGYRATITDRSKVFEYVIGSTSVTDDVNVLSSSIGGNKWVYVSSNSLREQTASADKEILEVTPEELLEGQLDSYASNPVALKFWIENNGATNLTSGELLLNEYSSDKSLKLNFLVTILGYVNLSNYSLVTNNVDNLNISQSYVDTKIPLSTPLPPNHAYVFSLVPDLGTSRALFSGTSVTLYPLLSPFTTFEGSEYWAAPVDSISALKSLQTTQFFNGQARFSFSNSRIYVFDITSSATDNGADVLIPNAWSGNGRWLAQEAVINDGSIEPSNLSNATLALISGAIKTTTVTISAPGEFALNLDSSAFDYYIVQCPVTDAFNTGTVINVTRTMPVDSTYAVVLELRQLTSLITFHNTFATPGGTSIVLTGNTKTDLVLVTFTRSTSSTIKKRVSVLQRDIG